MYEPVVQSPFSVKINVQSPFGVKFVVLVLQTICSSTYGRLNLFEFIWNDEMYGRSPISP